MQVFNDPDSGFVSAHDSGEGNWINAISEHVKRSNARPSLSLILSVIGKVIVQFDILFSFMASFQWILDD